MGIERKAEGLARRAPLAREERTYRFLFEKRLRPPPGRCGLPTAKAKIKSKSEIQMYHLNAKTGSKAKGRTRGAKTKKSGKSAKAKSDYITRQGRYKNDNDEVLHTLSGNMPEWGKEKPGNYWRAADTYERANGRLYKEVTIALPIELNIDQQKELVDSFAQHLTQGENLPYELAIHAGKGENPHCHLMISERANDGVDRHPEIWFKRHNAKKPEESGAKKTDKLKPKKWLEDARKDWASMANFALEKYGHDKRIDERSLKNQGINREPQMHIGAATMALEEKGEITERGERALEIERRNVERERIGEVEPKPEPRKPDREIGVEVGPTPERKRPDEKPRRKVVNPREQPRTQNEKVAKNRPHIWSRVSSWLDDRFSNFWKREPDQVVLKTEPKPEPKVTKEFVEAKNFFENLKKRNDMTPAQRAVENSSENRQKDMKADQEKIKEYEKKLERKPKSASANRNLEM